MNPPNKFGGFLGSATAVEPEPCIHHLLESRCFLVQHKKVGNNRMNTGNKKAYKCKWARFRKHIDWYLEYALDEEDHVEWTLNEIIGVIQKNAGIRPSATTILDYNRGRFEDYQIAPLERAGADTFKLNQNYYKLFGGAVREPRSKQPGRPRGTNPLPKAALLKSKPRYRFWYYRLTTQPERTPLIELFDEDDLIDISTIQQHLDLRTSVTFGPKAINTIMQYYIANKRGPPYIEEADSGGYRRIQSHTKSPLNQ